MLGIPQNGCLSASVHSSLQANQEYIPKVNSRIITSFYAGFAWCHIISKILQMWSLYCSSRKLDELQNSGLHLSHAGCRLWRENLSDAGEQEERAWLFQCFLGPPPSELRQIEIILTTGKSKLLMSCLLLFRDISTHEAAAWRHYVFIYNILSFRNYHDTYRKCSPKKKICHISFQVSDCLGMCWLIEVVGLTLANT